MRADIYLIPVVDRYWEGSGAVERRCEVRVSRGSGLEWLVWLDDLVAGRFLVMCEALDYASTLECSPRARREAVAS